MHMNMSQNPDSKQLNARRRHLSVSNAHMRRHTEALYSLGTDSFTTSLSLNNYYPALCYIVSPPYLVIGLGVLGRENVEDPARPNWNYANHKRS